MSDRFIRTNNKATVWFEKDRTYGTIVRFVNGHPIDFVKWNPPDWVDRKEKFDR